MMRVLKVQLVICAGNLATYYKVHYSDPCKFSNEKIAKNNLDPTGTEIAPSSICH